MSRAPKKRTRKSPAPPPPAAPTPLELKELRRRADVTLLQLGKKLGMSGTQLDRIETGIVDAPPCWTEHVLEALDALSRERRLLVLEAVTDGYRRNGKRKPEDSAEAEPAPMA